jgi:hypothetical protein
MHEQTTKGDVDRNLTAEWVKTHGTVAIRIMKRSSGLADATDPGIQSKFQFTCR